MLLDHLVRIQPVLWGELGRGERERRERERGEREEREEREREKRREREGGCQYTVQLPTLPLLF